MMEENSKAKRKKPKRSLYDNKEFMVLFEMVKGGKAYSKVQHNKCLLQASCLNCKEPLWTSLDLWARLKDGFLNPSAIPQIKTI